MNGKNLIFPGLAIVAVILSVFAFFHKSVPGTPGQNGQNGQNFGSVASPDIPSPYVQWGGVYHYSVGGDCLTNTNLATSTLFAIQNPAAATSTLIMLHIYGTQGATTTDFVVGTSTTPAPSTLINATTTFPATGSSTYMGAFAVPTSSAYFLAGNETDNFAHDAAITRVSNYTNQAIMTLGPTEYLIGISTSTFGGGNAGRNGSLTSGLMGIPSTCHYSAEFVR